MSTTTQILFNSPALHSLKRNQLVKLCKIHSLKASGKTKELIERLQLHAKTLPLDDPLSIAARSDNLDARPTVDSEDEASSHSGDGNVSMSNTLSRPSEQWEVVMDAIAEVDEETLRSNRGASDRQVCEFGTTTSKGSVTSSLRAIATSLGLKRNTSEIIGTTSSSSSLSSREVVQSPSTLPTSDSGGGPAGPPAEPIPGQSDLQGLPAPSHARLSLSKAPATTTIRLVSNPTTDPEPVLSPPKLEPFSTSFDLIPGTPGGSDSPSVPVWPLSPGGVAREFLYPAIPTFQGFGDLDKQQFPPSVQYDNSDMDIDMDIPGGLAAPSIHEPTPEKTNTSARFNTGATPKSIEKPSFEPVDIFSPAPKLRDASIRSRLDIPRSKPFVFGSPLPQHNTSNLQFRTAAQSVLDEMNKKLVEAGVEAVEASVLNNRRTMTEESTGKEEGNSSLRVGNMFERIHQKQFEKMDSITSHYAAKRGVQITNPQPILSKKRKSSLVVKERKTGVQAVCHRPNGYRVASGASVKRHPGDFGGEEDEEDDIVNSRLSKRLRVEREEPEARAQPGRAPVTPTPDPEEEARKEKEREAVRRKLEHNKAKRRSSKGRPSFGRAPPPNAKPTRLGFFATARSLVQNVWNRGAGSKGPSNIPVSKPTRLTEETKAPTRPIEGKKSAVVPGSSGAPPVNSQGRRIPSGSSITSLQSDAPGRSRLAAPVVGGGGRGPVSSSGILKSPTASFNVAGSSAAADTRSSTVAGHSRSNNIGGSLVGFSSLSAKTGLVTNNSHACSMGTKSNIKTSMAKTEKYAGSIPRSRTWSTLMAPTASSLAKTNGHTRIPVPTAPQNSTFTKARTSSRQRFALSPQPSATLEQNTNSPRGPSSSACAAKIFSQPLSPPAAHRPMSLAVAATSIAGQGPKEKQTSMLKSPTPAQTKVPLGRRPRISRSKVIARLASQRAANASSSAGAGSERAGSKVRSSMGAEVAGRGRSGDIMMNAKRRVRQSEYARRRSRTAAGAGEGRQMDVD